MASCYFLKGEYNSRKKGVADVGKVFGSAAAASGEGEEGGRDSSGQGRERSFGSIDLAEGEVKKVDR